VKVSRATRFRVTVENHDRRRPDLEIKFPVHL
jgi:hypothetical protein